jgi:hypothetical protein
MRTAVLFKEFYFCGLNASYMAGEPTVGDDPRI